MKKPANGMQMFHEQVNDRVQWQLAIDERNSLIARAKQIGVKLENPHNMKVSKIKELLREEKRNAKHRNRRS